MRRLAFAFSLAFVGLAGCASKSDGGPKVRPPPVLVVTKVDARDVPVEVHAPVDLRPLAQADVGSKTLGYLDAVLVDRGDEVDEAQRASARRTTATSS